MSEPVLELRGASFGYRGRAVLRDVTLSVGEREFWFLLGPNGQGKTTLLNAFLGALEPQAGTVVRRVGLESLGFVPQRSDPNPTLPTTVREFVSLGLAGIRDEPVARLEEALHKVGLPGFERRSLWTLSGGELQRALVARALVRRPRLLLVDEPTNHLDPVAEHTLLEAICELHRKEGLTVVFVTHDLVLARKYGSHVALFAGGEVRSGPAERMLTASELQWTFGVPFEVRKDADGAVGVHIRP